MEMNFRLPESEISGTYAVGVKTYESPEAITFDFFANPDPRDMTEQTVVRRIRFSPSALEHFYLEIQGILDRRRTQG